VNLSRLEPQDRPLHQPGRQTTQFLSTRLLSTRRLLRGARVVAAPLLALVVLAALPLDVALSVNTTPPVEVTAEPAAAEVVADIAVADITDADITRPAAMPGPPGQPTPPAPPAPTCDGPRCPATPTATAEPGAGASARINGGAGGGAGEYWVIGAAQAARSTMAQPPPAGGQPCSPLDLGAASPVR
jgi:hypothetical protein